MDWLLLSRDCWVEIFGWLSYQERNRVRRICKTWNEWITQHKPFWPIGYKPYQLVMKAIRTESYKVSKIELNHTSNSIYIGPFNTILITGYSENNEFKFWIYSRNDYSLLYKYNQEINNLEISNNIIIVQNDDSKIYFLSFDYVSVPKELLKEKQKSEWIYDEKITNFSFDYPFLLVYCNGKRTIMDVRTKTVILSSYDSLDFNRYIFIVKQSELSFHGGITTIYDINRLDKAPIVIFPGVISQTFLCNHLCFVKYAGIIECHNIKTGKKTLVSFYDNGYVQFNKSFVYSNHSDGKCIIYKWNSDYTELNFVDSYRDSSIKEFVDCFHPSFHFVSFLLKTESGSFLLVYSEITGKKIAQVELISKKEITGDDLTRVYFESTDSEGNDYLRVIDFAC